MAELLRYGSASFQSIVVRVSWLFFRAKMDFVFMRFAIIFMSLSFTASCGGAGDTRSAFVEACVSEGSNESSCNCIASAMQGALTEGQFANVTDLAVQGDSDAGEEYFQQLFAAHPETAGEFSRGMQGCGA